MFLERFKAFKQLYVRKWLLVLAGALVSAWQLLIFRTSTEDVALFVPSGSSISFGLTTVGSLVSCGILLFLAYHKKTEIVSFSRY